MIPPLRVDIPDHAKYPDMEVCSRAWGCFSKQQKIQLLPFAMTFTLYFLQPYPQNTFFGVIFKVLPDLSLVVFIVLNQSNFLHRRTTLRLQDLLPDKRHALLMMAGLLLASLGDLFLAHPEILIVPGGFVYILCHSCYYSGIETDGKHSSTKSLFFLAYLAAFLSCQSGVDSVIEKAVIGVYMVPLFMVGWKATAKFEDDMTDVGAFLGCIGALLFIASDIIIILDFWGFPIPCAEFFFMTTYYLAQFGHATSVSDFN